MKIPKYSCFEIALSLVAVSSFDRNILLFEFEFQFSFASKNNFRFTAIASAPGDAVHRSFVNHVMNKPFNEKPILEYKKFVEPSGRFIG